MASQIRRVPITTAINNGVTTQLNQLGRRARCHPLDWTLTAGRLSGHAGAEYADVDVPDVLAGWASYLGLHRQERPTCTGTTEYRGRVGGWDVEVWGVHDRDAFECEATRARQERGEQR